MLVHMYCTVLRWVQGPLPKRDMDAAGTKPLGSLAEAVEEDRRRRRRRGGRATGRPPPTVVPIPSFG